MPNLIRGFVILLFFISLFAFSTRASAELKWNAESQSTYTMSNLLETGVFALSGVCSSTETSVKVTGSSGATFDNCQKVATSSASGGAIGYTANSMAYLYNPPTSSVYYLANLGENLGLGPRTAYAQVAGSGNGIIAPVLELWKVTRNLAYLAFILIFVTVGFMIMFRQKINPQTVITAQAALPGLIIGLVLVTFSYFIAAFIIDFAFVGIRLVTELFILSKVVNSLGTDSQLQGHAQNANIFWLFMGSGLNADNIKVVWQGTSGQLFNLTGGSLTGGIGWGHLFTAIVGAIAGAIVGPLGILGGVALGGTLGLAAIPVIIPGIVILVLLIALFIQMFRLLFALIGAYIAIFVATLAGPFYILIGSLPGRGGAITSWLKTLLANVLIFPAVFAAFLFAGLILGDNKGWSGNVTLPLFGGLDKNFVRVLLAYGILLGSPAIPDMIKNAFGVKDSPFGKTALQGATSGWGVASGGGNKAWQATGLPQYRQSILDTRNKEFAAGHTPVAPITGGARGRLSGIFRKYLTR